MPSPRSGPGPSDLSASSLEPSMDDLGEILSRAMLIDVPVSLSGESEEAMTEEELMVSLHEYEAVESDMATIDAVLSKMEEKSAHVRDLVADLLATQAESKPLADVLSPTSSGAESTDSESASDPEIDPSLAPL
eukprot:m.415027 g.415027  ORF g.415027 m.415027 type:complete len:134 (+) comp29504_c0_seq1:193-594(+)